MNDVSSGVVIVGASHAAAEAISTLRKADWQGSITLIGDEPELPYQRPPLSKAYYQGQLAVEKLLIKNAAFYEKAKVDLRLGQRVTHLDRTKKQLVLEDQSIVGYQHLILATGTRARRLNIPGADLPQVKYLRTKADVDEIKRAAKPASKLLIVGAGYIGLELAASAIKQGIQVTVLEAQERVLARVTSPEVSDFFQALHAREGVDIRLNTALESFAVDGQNYVAQLADGEQLEFDCAVVGIGVVPNVELAEEAGLPCDNGIVVDEYTRTIDDTIYAVGDCCAHPNAVYGQQIRLESVPNAVAQAKTAALTICGREQVYNQLPWFWSDQYDVKLQTAGLLNGYDETRLTGSIAEVKFSVAYYRQGKLIALDAINSPAEFMKAKKAILQSLHTDSN